MSNLEDVRAAIVSRIVSSCGIDALPYWPDVVTPPVVCLGYGSPAIQFGGVLSEQAEVLQLPGAPPSPNNYRLQAIVIVSRAITEDAQRSLDKLIDSNATREAGLYSIPDALLLDDTLNGVVEWCLPVDVTMPGLINVAGQDYFHAAINLQVSA